jgi:hypothetical protein
MGPRVRATEVICRQACVVLILVVLLIKSHSSSLLTHATMREGRDNGRQIRGHATPEHKSPGFQYGAGLAGNRIPTSRSIAALLA